MRRPQCLIDRDARKKKQHDDMLSPIHEDERISDLSDSPALETLQMSASRAALEAHEEEEHDHPGGKYEDDDYSEESESEEDDDEFLGYYERAPHPPVYAPPETRRRNPLMVRVFYPVALSLAGRSQVIANSSSSCSLHHRYSSANRSLRKWRTTETRRMTTLSWSQRRTSSA